MRNLTPRQKRFADEYLKGTPAGRAWERAGYRARGAAADVEACRALRLRSIKTYLDQERAMLLESARIERKQLLDWLERLIFTPIGKVTEHSDLPHAFSMRVDKQDITYLDIKLPSKIEAVKMVCHLMGWGPPPVPNAEGDTLHAFISSLRINTNQTTPV